MRHVWVVDVLIDLRDFALGNNLHDLAHSLEEARRIYAEEVERPLLDEKGHKDYPITSQN